MLKQISTAFILWVLTTLIAVPSIALAGDTTKQPNVIIVLTDDQGYGELSSHGHPYLKTPHLDRLAAIGVELTDFHVSSKCSPTRGALLTGRHCKHVGVREADNGRCTPSNLGFRQQSNVRVEKAIS